MGFLTLDLYLGLPVTEAAFDDVSGLIFPSPDILGALIGETFVGRFILGACTLGALTLPSFGVFGIPGITSSSPLVSLDPS
jgi:hypothetical protein